MIRLVRRALHKERISVTCAYIRPSRYYDRYFSNMRMHMCKKKYDVTFGSRYEAVRTLFHHPGEAKDYLARVSTGEMHRQRTSYIRSTLRYA